MDFQKIWEIILPYLKNKYVLSLIVFTLYLGFFDPNNLMDRIASVKKLKQLEKDKEYYIERITEDTKRMKELKTDNDNLEKFAREQYLMKKENEDIFIIVKED
ncbi:MAG: septum formation initiator family protein [Bacteroidales bacterium]|nr:septum formation initiator family protein [Bacteroidales bacterium]